jgi:hypothetical protein
MRLMPDYHISIVSLGFACRSVRHHDHIQFDPMEFART